MMESEGVSVVIPTYNRRECLREAVESVLNQTSPPGEVIVVDDGSEDDTASLVMGWGVRVRYLRTARRGVSAARNAGVEMCRGQWIAFLDSDDLWLPDKLRIQMEFLGEHPEYPICQTEEMWIRHGRRVNAKKYHEKPDGHCFERLLERCLVSPSAVVLNRSLLDEVGGFDEEMPACEDYDLWLRIGCRYPFGLVRDPLVVKRGGHGDQLSRSTPSLDRWRIWSLEKILRSDQLTATQARMALSVLRKKCRIYAGGCIKRGRHEEAQLFASLPGLLMELRTS
jgi:glycosyltransferase involved in cell wall biosynthesis